MKPVFRAWQSDDFMKVRQFLIDSYKTSQKPYNNTLERWNFGYSLDRAMHQVPEATWCRRVGIWEQDQEIVGLVHGEGPGGYALAYAIPGGLPEETLDEMFAFAEIEIAMEIDGELAISINIPEDDQQRKTVAQRRGYTKTDSLEPYARLNTTGRSFEPELPPGFVIKAGNNFTTQELGLSHAKAFGYADNQEYVWRSPIGYGWMHKTPDYRADQDLYVVSDKGEIASFCTIWHDETNKIAILEPVGTHPEYRKLGLAKAVIHECINRVIAKGADTIWVSSYQPFYLAIGFDKAYSHEVWEMKL